MKLITTDRMITRTYFPSFLVLCLLLLATPLLKAQSVMMQGWYWEYPKSPTTATNFAVQLNNKVEELEQAGFTHMWLPPLSKGSFGGFSNGYDPRDLYDLGEYGDGATGFGTRSEAQAVIDALTDAGIQPMADVIYNHRDGGDWEENPAVENWIENFSFSQAAAGNTPYPSDRWRCYIPLGGTSGNTAGDYYFKISSASQHPFFHGLGYEVIMRTNRKDWAFLPDLTEVEPNGGGDCGQPFNDIEVGRKMIATVDGSACTADEFHLDLKSTDFFAAGDTLWITLTNTGGYSDHRIYGIWSALAGADIQSQVRYITPTNFNNMPSGRGGMNWSNFRPNGSPTSLAGDWEYPWFFYDYDNNAPGTFDTLATWTEWLYDEIDIRGLRCDAVKHFDPAFLGGILNQMHSNGKDMGLVVGELFDYNPFVLKNWVNNVEGTMSSGALANTDIKVFDFGLRAALKEACDGFGYDARNIFNSGVAGSGAGSGFDAVTFVNNHDFRDPGTPVQNDPILAYAYILMNNRAGIPAVYYPDYYGVSRPNAPTINMKFDIDRLISAQQNFVAGATSVEYLNNFGSGYFSSYSSGAASNSVLLQTGNAPSGIGTLTAINFSGADLVLTQAVNTGGMDMAVGDTLWLVAGNATGAYMVVNNSSRVSINIPSRSFAVWANCTPPSAPVSNGDVAFCPGDPNPTISVVDEGLIYNWWTSPTGGLVVASNTPIATAILGAGSYWVEAVEPCGTSVRTEVIVTEDVAACGGCVAPASISDGSITSTSVVINWSPAADAFGYQLSGKKLGAAAWKTINTISTSQAVNILQPSNTYEYRVRTYCNTGEWSEFSPVQTFSTPSSKTLNANIWNAYPNPTSSILYLNGTLHGTSSDWQLVDALGRVVLVGSLPDAGDFHLSLDVSKLTAGVYQLVLRSGGEINTRSVSILDD